MTSPVQAQTEAESRPRNLIITVALAGIIGAASIVFNASGALDGEIPAIGRMLLGLVGVAGAALLWIQPQSGWLVCILWAAIQIPYFAWNTEGCPVSQVLYFPVSASNETRVNWEITSFSEYGINLVGVALTILIYRWRAQWLSRYRWPGSTRRHYRRAKPRGA